MAQIPNFEADGLLPAGDYEVTLDQLRHSILVAGGKSAAPTWDAAWRGLLVDNLAGWRDSFGKQESLTFSLMALSSKRRSPQRH